MGYKVRQIEPGDQFCEQVTVEVINQVVSLEAIGEVIEASDAREQRVRKMPAWLTLLLCIVMNLLTEVGMSYVLVRMVRGTRLLADVDLDTLAQKSSISKARYRLGAKPLEMLFKRICRPIATPETPGAFAFGLRLVAIDGTLEDATDTPGNAAYFGHRQTGHGDGPFPQVRCVYVCECGTHAIFDAGFWPYRVGESTGAYRVLRSVTEGMLVMWDRGLYSYDRVIQVRQRGAHVLCWVRSMNRPPCIKRLSDGTYLAYIYPSDPARRESGEKTLVRAIEYTLDDPRRPGHGEHHCLLTTLLDPDAYPVMDLLCLYHERWEIEIAIDEIDTHQRLLPRPLRSLKPVGVIQELYALLIAHFIIRFIMHEAACTHQLDPDRLSFVNSVRLICDAIPEFQMIHPDDHFHLWHRLLKDIAHFQLPPRENRINPRVVKRRCSKFQRKRPEDFHHPPLTQSFRDSIVLAETACA